MKYLLRLLFPWFHLRPKWLSKQMEQTISECLSGTGPGSKKVFVPVGATAQEAALCHTVWYYLHGNKKTPEPIPWGDEAQRFVVYLISSEFEQHDPDVVNAESVVVFEAIRQAFTLDTQEPLSVNPVVIANIAAFSVLALQHDSFERMNDATSRKLLVSALHSLLTFIQYCVRENFNFRDKNKRYYVGQLELPLWLVEKYSSKETPVST